MGRTTDHLVETALTTVLAYGWFLFAEHLHVSGVLATVTAGLFMAIGPLSSTGDTLSEWGRVFVVELWEFAAFLANSLIFLLIGLRVCRHPVRHVGSTGFDDHYSADSHSRGFSGLSRCWINMCCGGVGYAERSDSR